MGQSCRECRRFLPKSLLCSHCGTDNNNSDNNSPVSGGLPVVRRVEPPVSHPVAPVGDRRGSADILSSLSDLMDLVTAMSTRLATFEGAVGSVESFGARMDALDATLGRLERVMAGVGALTARVGELGGRVDEIAGEQRALAARLDDIEARMSSLHRPGAAGGGAAGSVEMESMARRLERVERDNRERELIIFGLPNVQAEVRRDTLASVTRALGVSQASSDVVASARIAGRDQSARPLTVRFATAGTRSDWMSGFRRRRYELYADEVVGAWPHSRTRIFERSSSAERKFFNDARALARDKGVARIWMRGGAVFFRRSDGSRVERYVSPASLGVPAAAPRAGPSTASGRDA